MDQIVARYAGWIERHCLQVIGIVLLVVTGLGLGLPHLTFTSDYRVYFGESNPQRETYEQFERTYAQTDNILIVVKPKRGDIFTPEVLTAVRAITEGAWQIPHSIRVDSITNFQDIRAEGDELVVEDLVPEDVRHDDIATIRETAMDTHDLVGNLVSRDAGAAGINVTLQFPGEDHHNHLIQSVTSSRELIERFSTQYQNLTIVQTGIAPLGYAEYSVSERETRTLFPWVFALLLVIAWFVLRSLVSVIMVAILIALSTVATMGFFGWLGFAINTTSAAAPIVIMTLAVADSVHILLSAIQAMNHGKSRSTAIQEAMTLNWEPVFLTSFTTAVGFLSLNFSDVPPFQDVGNIAATGVAMAWLFSVTLLPAMMCRLGIDRSQPAEIQAAFMGRLAEFVIRHRRWILIVLIPVPVLCILALPRIELDDRFVKWFDPDEPVRQDADFASEHLMGPFRLEISVPSGTSDGVYEPEYLSHLSAFQEWMANQPDVQHVSSIVPLLKRINRALHEGDDEYYRLPATRQLAAQLILLYELSLPYGRDLTTNISLDKSSTRITVTLKEVSSAEIRQISGRATDWFARNTPEEMHTSPTGTAVIFSHLALRNIIAMLWGTGIAFVVIALVLVFALRSPSLGALSLIPNGFPVLITFGIWALVVGEIGIIASVIAATSMGLIVDDTVHILSKYRRARGKEGLSSPDAVRYVFEHVGTALWSTSVILVCGFLVLTLSAFELNEELGILTAMTIAIALIMDLTLLPALLIVASNAKARLRKGG